MNDTDEVLTPAEFADAVGLTNELLKNQIAKGAAKPSAFFYGGHPKHSVPPEYGREYDVRIFRGYVEASGHYVLTGHRQTGANSCTWNCFEVPSESGTTTYGGIQGRFCTEGQWDKLVFHRREVHRFCRDVLGCDDEGDTGAGKVKGNTRTHGITKSQVIQAFDGCHFNASQWKKYLADPPAWLKVARVQKGSKSVVKQPALWDPVLLALAVLEHRPGELYRKYDKLFKTYPFMQPWRDEWEQKTELFRASTL